MFYTQCHRCNKRWELGESRTCTCRDYSNPQPKREWVGLTNEEIKKAVLDEHNGGFAFMSMMRDEVMMKEVRQAINLIARAIEAKLKDKNT